jgi:Fe-S-cluster-containing dehydrogenase component
MCLQCEKAACVSACPAGAMHREQDGTIKCDTDKCVGCKLCVSACLMGNVHFNPKTKRIIKCELCGGDPGCVKYCSAGALVYSDGDDALGRKKAMAHILNAAFGKGA